MEVKQLSCYATSCEGETQDTVEDSVTQEEIAPQAHCRVIASWRILHIDMSHSNLIALPL